MKTTERTDLLESFTKYTPGDLREIANLMEQGGFDTIEIEGDCIEARLERDMTPDEIAKWEKLKVERVEQALRRQAAALGFDLVKK